MRSHPQSGRQSKWIIGVIIVVTLLIAIITYGIFLRGNSDVDSDKYQAVFLSNGQAYFGKLEGYGTATPKMSDVYYFQAGEAPQGDKNEQAAQTLVKLGDEIHKPDDTLLLNADAILFVENLSGEGSVVQAIEENE